MPSRRSAPSSSGQPSLDTPAAASPTLQDLFRLMQQIHHQQAKMMKKIDRMIQHFQIEISSDSDEEDT